MIRPDPDGASRTVTRKYQVSCTLRYMRSTGATGSFGPVGCGGGNPEARLAERRQKLEKARARRERIKRERRQAAAEITGKVWLLRSVEKMEKL